MVYNTEHLLSFSLRKCMIYSRHGIKHDNAEPEYRGCNYSPGITAFTRFHYAEHSRSHRQACSYAMGYRVDKLFRQIVIHHCYFSFCCHFSSPFPHDVVLITIYHNNITMSSSYKSFNIYLILIKKIRYHYIWYLILCLLRIQTIVTIRAVTLPYFLFST